MIRVQGGSFFRVIMLLIIGSVLGGCTAPSVLYLTPGRYLEPVSSGKEGAKIVLEKFAESFSAEGDVGWHLIGSQDQKLRVKPERISKTIDSLLGDAFYSENVLFSRGSGWDRSLAGLSRRTGGGSIVVGGEITRFSMVVKTGYTRLTSDLEISMNADCLVGFVDEGKIVRKTVHMNKKVLKFSANQKEMEKILDGFLAEAVKEIYNNIEEFVD